MAQDQKQLGSLFAGTLYLSQLSSTTGLYGGYETVETDKMEIKTPSERLEAISRSRENYGQAHTSYNRGQPSEISFNFTQQTMPVMAAKLAGVLSDVTAAQTALADVAVEIGVLGMWYPIGHLYLDEANLVVKDGTSATTTYAKGTDYEINPRLGLIRGLEGGAITAGSTVKISGNAGATEGHIIHGAKQYSQEFRGFLDGINLVTQEDVIVDMPRIVVSSDDAQDFLQENLAQTALSGRLLIPSGGGDVFTLRYLKRKTP